MKNSTTRNGHHRAAHGSNVSDLVNLLANTKAEYISYRRSGISSGDGDIDNIDTETYVDVFPDTTSRTRYAVKTAQQSSTTGPNSGPNTGTADASKDKGVEKNKTKIKTKTDSEYKRLIQAMELALELSIFNKFNAQLHTADIPADLLQRIQAIYKEDTNTNTNTNESTTEETTTEKDTIKEREERDRGESGEKGPPESRVSEESPSPYVRARVRVRARTSHISYVSLILPEVYHTSLHINKDRSMTDIRTEIANGQVYLQSNLGSIQPSTFTGSNRILCSMISNGVNAVRAEGNLDEKQDIEMLMYVNVK